MIMIYSIETHKIIFNLRKKMKQILKRLELIQTSIELDDEEIIELQILKLKKLTIENEVYEMIAKLENLDYSSVVLDIEAYLQRYSGVALYVDSEVQGLKLELKALEKKLQNLTELRDEYLNDIEEFNTLYSLKLGNIIQKILRITTEIFEKAIKEKQEIFEKEKELYEEIKDDFVTLNSEKRELEDQLAKLDVFDDEYDKIYEEYQSLKKEFEEKEEEFNTQREKTKKAKEELEDDPLFEEYHEAKNDYEDFSSDYEEIKEREEQKPHLDEDEKKELKRLYRKASRICHPDIVADELKVQATEIMKQLNEAYDNKDIEKVKEILASLENGTSFDVASDKIDDKKILKNKIKEFREKISVIEQELDRINEDESFQTIENIEDMDNYFERLKEELEEEYEALRGRME